MISSGFPDDLPVLTTETMCLLQAGYGRYGYLTGQRFRNIIAVYNNNGKERKHGSNNQFQPKGPTRGSQGKDYT